MKKALSIILALILTASLVVVGSLSGSAETIYHQDGYAYTLLSGTTAGITGLDADTADLVVPKGIGNYYITEIRDSAFKGKTGIASVDMTKASMLQVIGYYAFMDCTSLSGSVTITGRVYEIGDSAFQGCTSMNEIRFLNARITDVPAQCCYGCNSLSSVDFSTDSITTIEKFAFANCTSLKEVTIPTNITTIDPTAFLNDKELVIKCYTDSAAHQFAEKNGYEFILLDAPEPTEAPTDEPTQAPTEPPTAPTESIDPTEEPTSGQPVKVTFILGDADGDGQVTILDATKIQRVLVDLETDEDGMISLRGNVNNEDKLSIMHATKIQRCIADYETEEPIVTEVTVWI